MGRLGVTDERHFQDIAENIRKYAKIDARLRPSDMAYGVQDVYEQGVKDGGGGGGGTAPELPDLTNPADASDIRLNREAIAEDGSVLRGTMPEHSGENVELKILEDSFTVEEGFHQKRSVQVAYEQLIVAKAKKDETTYVAAQDNKFIGYVEVEPATDIYNDGKSAGMEEGIEAGRAVGYEEGYSKGLTDGFEDGKQVAADDAYDAGKTAGIDEGRAFERSEFWDAFQDGGARTNYNYAFYGTGWNDGNFYPKHNISPTAANTQGMFQTSGITNLKQRLIDCGVEMNTSGCTQLYNFAQGSSITHFPELGGSGVINANNTFNGCRQLVSVDKLSLSTSASCGCTNAFNNAVNLVEIRFNEGMRPENLNMKHCTKLSKNSIENLVSSIAKDHSTTVTISAAAIASAYPNRSEWTAFLDENKPANVTISEE